MLTALAFGVVAIVTVILIVDASPGNSRDERSYERGVEMGSAGGEARGLYDMGADPVKSCQEMIEILFAFGDDGLDIADVEQGCVDAMPSE